MNNSGGAIFRRLTLAAFHSPKYAYNSDASARRNFGHARNIFGHNYSEKVFPLEIDSYSRLAY